MVVRLDWGWGRTAVGRWVQDCLLLNLSHLLLVLEVHDGCGTAVSLVGHPREEQHVLHLSTP